MGAFLTVLADTGKITSLIAEPTFWAEAAGILGGGYLIKMALDSRNDQAFWYLIIGGGAVVVVSVGFLVETIMKVWNMTGCEEAESDDSIAKKVLYYITHPVSNLIKLANGSCNSSPNNNLPPDFDGHCERFVDGTFKCYPEDDPENPVVLCQRGEKMVTDNKGIKHCVADYCSLSDDGDLLSCCPDDFWSEATRYLTGGHVSNCTYSCASGAIVKTHWYGGHYCDSNSQKLASRNVSLSELDDPADLPPIEQAPPFEDDNHTDIPEPPSPPPTPPPIRESAEVHHDRVGSRLRQIEKAKN